MAECIDESAVLRRALDTYGSWAQVMMVFEEMSELQKELCKYLRGRGSFEHIAEEIADVEIMLEQMKLLFLLRRRCARLAQTQSGAAEREAGQWLNTLSEKHCKPRWCVSGAGLPINDTPRAGTIACCG